MHVGQRTGAHVCVVLCVYILILILILRGVLLFDGRSDRRLSLSGSYM